MSSEEVGEGGGGGGGGSGGFGMGADQLNFQQSPEPNATFEGGLVF